jgi:hypothetical protein
MAQDIQNIEIKTADDFVTNLDSVDQKSNYFRKVRGIRNLGVEFVAQRDFGAIHRLAAANYPAPVVAGIASIHRIHTFHDSQTGYDHEIVVLIDTTNNRVRIYVDTSTDSSGTWLELTRTFIAKVNGTPSTTTKTVNIDTLLENGASVTLSSSEIIGFIVFNVTRTSSAFLTANGATSLTADNYFGSDGLAWQDNDDLIFFRTAGHFKAYLGNTQAFTTGLLSTAPHFEFNPIPSQRKVNVYYGSAEDHIYMSNPVQIEKRDQRVFFGTTGGTYLVTIPARWDMEALGGGLIPSYVEVGSITSPIIGATGQTSTNIIDQNSGDIVGQMLSQVIQNGTPTDDYYGTNVYATFVYSDYQESDPFYKVYSKVFVTDSTSWLALTPKIDFSKLCKEITAIRFYGEYATKTEVESHADVLKDSDVNYKLFREVRIGVASAIAGSTTYSVGNVNGAWLTISPQGGYHVGDVCTLVGGSGDATVIVTKVDTLFGAQITYYSLSNPGTSGYSTGSYAVTGGNGTGLVVVVTSVVAHNSTPTDNWSLVSTSPYPFQMSYVSANFGLIDGLAINLGNKSLEDTLQHEKSTNRTIKRPRFGISTVRSENPISVIDTDDRTLAYSTIDGYGVVEDDNFAEAGADNTGTLLKANLFGILPIKSIINLNNQIHVFRQSLREIIDTQSGYQGSRQCDFYANRSVVSSPFGIAWAGYSGIYFIPTGDLSEFLINQGWQNLFDGTLKIDDGSVSYITDQYRSAIVSGYDPTFREFWFHCQVNKDAADGGGSEYLCFRFSPENKRWTVRQLNIGASYSPVVAFSQRSDATMSIVYATGILKYPNRLGTYQYTDDTPSTGASTGKGIPTEFKLIVGEIADKYSQSVPVSILPDYRGSSISGAGRLQINLYANKETTPYDTQYFPVDIKEDEIRFTEERDNVSEFMIEVLIPSSDLADVANLDISTLYIGLIRQLRGGNI